MSPPLDDDAVGQVTGTPDVCGAPDCENPRRENGTGGRSRWCTAHEWKRRKAVPAKHDAAKAANRKASATFRKTDGRRRALKTDALKRGHGTPRSVWAVLTREEWIALWEETGRRCPVCLNPLRNRFDPASTGALACIEHDHKIEKALLAAGVPPDSALRQSIRGMMCTWDNHRVLTMVRDSADYAQRVADYLRTPPAKGRFQ